MNGNRMNGMNGMNGVGALVRRIAVAYVAAQGNTFEANGVRLPLNAEVMAVAIDEDIVTPVMEDPECRAGLVPLLAEMLNGDTISERGRLTLDGLLGAICHDIKEADNKTGIDPLGCLPKELRELGPMVIGGYRNQPPCPEPDPDYQARARALACVMAAAFVADHGVFYLSEGAQGAIKLALPLTPDNVAEAIRWGVVDGAGQAFGEPFALHMLRLSLNGEALTGYGRRLIRSMLEEVCEAMREMMAEGRDPWTELARMQAEQTTGAGS